MKRFAIVAIFLTLLFVGNAHAENQSGTDIKIEQIKEDIKKLETDLTKLEDDVDDSKDDKLENKKDLESLDKRVGDIDGDIDRFGVLVAFFSIFITVLLLGFGFATYNRAKNDAKKQAEDATKEWIEKEGNKQLELSMKRLEEEAKRKIEKAVKTAKENIERQAKAKELFLEGYTNSSSNEYDKAIEAYQKAIEINPKYYNAYYNMGNAYRLMKDYNKAIEAFQKAIEINPKRYEAYSNMGYAYNNLKEYDKAIEAFQKAIEINPKNDNVYLNMAFACVHSRKYDKAIQAYQKIIEINPKLDVGYINLFELELMRNQDFSLEEQFLLYFEEDKESMMKYEMLKILQMIATNKSYDLTAELWSEKYHNIKLYWRWDELDAWLDDMQDSDIKTKLSEALEVFKNHNESLRVGCNV